MGWSIRGISDGDLFGWSMANVGDVDGDGRDDFLFGSYGSDSNGEYSGEAYLVTSSALVFADREDGERDFRISLENAIGLRGSYKLTGPEEWEYTGWSVETAGDVDGDGLNDLLIGGIGSIRGSDDPETGSAFLLTAAAFQRADRADGQRDWSIDLSISHTVIGSYTFVGTPEFIQGDSGSYYSSVWLGYSVASVGDFDQDGIDDFAISAPAVNDATSVAGNAKGVVYLVSGHDLPLADAADGVIDGQISVEFIAQLSGSYAIRGQFRDAYAGSYITNIGDIDADGKDDLLISEVMSPDKTNSSAYLISTGELANADAADGDQDGVIDLSNIAAQDGSYRIIREGEAVGRGNRGLADSVSLGDINEDGLGDFLLSGASLQGVVLVNSASLEAADAADGDLDGQVLLQNTLGLEGTYAFHGTLSAHYMYTVGNAGDFDGDGVIDLFIGDGDDGIVYLISGTDIETADAQDGTIDGNILLSNIASLPNSYNLIGDIFGAAGTIGFSMKSAGDLDGDGLGDLMIGEPMGGAGDVYLIYGSELTRLDMYDGSRDGVINIANTTYPFYGVEISGGPNADTIDGSEHGDILLGRGGDDTIYGYGGNDQIRGGADTDLLWGHAGVDRLFGGPGMDFLNGGDDNDWLRGGDGQDFLRGDAGDDHHWGEAGPDYFVFGYETQDFGIDRIHDFDAAEGDVLFLPYVDAITDYADLLANHVRQAGRHLVIEADSLNRIIILNTDIDDLESSNFVF